MPASVDRYLVFDEIGVGGMASVHIGMLTGAVGFRRMVALKQLHSRFIHDPDFVTQFIKRHMEEFTHSGQFLCLEEATGVGPCGLLLC